MQHIERQKLVISAENRTSFDEIRRDFCARHAPRVCRTCAETTDMCHAACNACALTLRVFLAHCAHVWRRNRAVLRLKFARFCAKFFNFQRDCSHRRTLTASKKFRRSFNACFTRCAALPELCGVFCSTFNGKNL